MSIIIGTDSIIDKWLSGTTENSLNDNSGVVAELLQVIEKNWTHQRSTAQSNWKWRQVPYYNDNENQQAEIIIERQIVEQGKRNWANQIPTASGLAGPNKDKRRAVDLAFHHGGREFTLFELKLASDTPLYAAKEILLHGLLYLFTRTHIRELGYEQRSFKLLEANIIHLRVLAPEAYYYGVDLRAVEDAIDNSLKQYCTANPSLKLKMDFQFEAFPPDFDWMLHRQALDARGLMQAVQARRPTYSSID